MERLRSLYFSRRAASSVPPVVAPTVSMIPMEAPSSTPPKMHASSGSSMGEKTWTAPMASSIREPMLMAYREASSDLSPCIRTQM